MALSHDLLKLIAALDRSTLPVDYLIDELAELGADDPLQRTQEEQSEDEDTTIEIRKLVELIVHAKREPTFRIAPSAIEMLREVIDERHLDDYFTIQALTNVPDTVKRWAKLANLGFQKAPGDKVTRYLQQAVECYLYGMYDAAAVLCRTTLEFSLREKLGPLAVKPRGGKADLEDLVDFCAKAKILTGEAYGKADAIRKRGNDAIHRQNCSDAMALQQLRETRQVLVQLYGEVKD